MNVIQFTAMGASVLFQHDDAASPLSDPFAPLVFPRNFNRISGPDTNSCAGCHNLPDIGGGGNIVANVFVLGQRFDFATFDAIDTLSTKGEMDERGLPATLQTVANSRKTVGMFGSGFIEMLARQITADLQAIVAATAPGQPVHYRQKVFHSARSFAAQMAPGIHPA